MLPFFDFLNFSTEFHGNCYKYFDCPSVTRLGGAVATIPTTNTTTTTIVSNSTNTGSTNATVASNSTNASTAKAAALSSTTQAVSTSAASSLFISIASNEEKTLPTAVTHYVKSLWHDFHLKHLGKSCDNPEENLIGSEVGYLSFLECTERCRGNRLCQYMEFYAGSAISIVSAVFICLYRVTVS